MNRALHKAGTVGRKIIVGCSVWLCGSGFLPLGLHTAAAADQPAEKGSVDFSRDILPILSDYCFTCHGPDQNQRKADLRLDTQEGALRTENPVIVPGKSSDSELILRIVSTDPGEVMPPPKSNRKLSARQIELLKQWIDSGAVWGRHWAYEAPRRPLLPEVKRSDWAQNPIDRFILARLERERLTPAPPARPETWLRRVTLDLTGLPPTLAEIEDFARDSSDQACQRVVDRLLNSPRYGERMAWDWLDAARYADTNGYQGDPTRSMWFWRDWVVEAMNRNLPFDQFTLEQLAGDLLPNPSREQLIATGFHRNHMINGEGGRIAEESRVDYVQDRVETTGTVWMGLTLNCCRCHDHKFDPVTQREYYQLAAYFNSIDESGATDAYPQARPLLPVPTPAQEARVAEMKQRESTSQKALAELEQKLRAGQPDWERALADQTGKPQSPEWTVLTPITVQSQAGATLTAQADGAVLATGDNPARDTFVVTVKTPGPALTGLKLEALPDASLVNSGPGRADNGNFVLTEVVVTADGRPLKLLAIAADHEQGGLPLTQAVDGKNDTGWAILPEFGKPHTGIFEIQDLPTSGTAERTLTIRLEFQSIHVSHVIGKFRLSTTSAPVTVLRPISEAIRQALAVEPEKRNDAQKKLLSEYYLGTIPGYAATKQQAEAARQAREQAEKEIPTTMIVRDLPQPRETFVLLRGAYDKRGDKVAHGTPTVLPALATTAPPNRLALAQWLISPSHPLTARVTVNRYWQTFFGTGLVKTAEDFGVQGEKPSHPELLDWLAREFVDSGWDVKHIHRLIVTSATYRQSSNAGADLIERDPENRLLARGPRYRLPSWMIRDQALAASGLLVNTFGGRGVRGYQPPGIWEDATFGQIRYEQEHGDALYRRSLYTFWRRIAGPTMFFDVASRQTCTVKIARTNTPLHALATLNDVTYIEAARGLAQRVLLNGPPDERARLAEMFRLIATRPPQPPELEILSRRLAGLLTTYRENESAAQKLIKVGETAAPPQLAVPELAAWTSLATLLFNLDESLSKE
ncbi:MAG: PSD1 domain-containing protein [Planctomycetes bacterium]|nr:PSD1 domain-containing protein [Planctomycetota bacterium]